MTVLAVLAFTFQSQGESVQDVLLCSHGLLDLWFLGWGPARTAGQWLVVILINNHYLGGRGIVLLTAFGLSTWFLVRQRVIIRRVGSTGTGSSSLSLVLPELGCDSNDPRQMASRLGHPVQGSFRSESRDQLLMIH